MSIDLRRIVSLSSVTHKLTYSFVFSSHRFSGSGVCSFQEAVSRGGSNNCLTFWDRTATGHRWCKDCWTAGRAAGASGLEPECTGTVEPDTVRISGRVFQLNGTMTTGQRAKLSKLFGTDIRATAIPAEFDKFEITDDDPED